MKKLSMAVFAVFAVLVLIGFLGFYAIMSGGAGASSVGEPFSLFGVWNGLSAWAGIPVIVVLLIVFGYLLSAFLRNAKAGGFDMENPLRPAAAALALVVVAIPVGMVIPSIREFIGLMATDPSGICQLIAAVTFTGLALDVVQYFGLRSEWKGLEEARLGVSDDGGAPFDSDKIDRLLNGRANGALRRKWRRLREVFEYVEHSDFETLVSFPDQGEFLKESKLSLIVKLLPLLGMIGTVMGFVMAVVGMQAAAADMADFNSFKGNMLNALGGMREAFLTTLAGMGGMVLVMFVNSLLVEARRRILLLEDEFLYVKVFLPGIRSHRRTAADEGK